MDKQEMSTYMREFSKEHTELLALRANIAAINKMLINRGKGDELFDMIKEVIEDYKKKVKK